MSLPRGVGPSAGAQGPNDLVYDASSGLVYVADRGSGGVSVIATTTDTVVDYLRVGTNPAAVAVDSANDYIFVADSGSDNLTVISGSTESVIASVPAGTYPVAEAFDSANGYVYVANIGSNNVTVVNGATDSVVGSIPVGSGPDAVAYDATNGYLYVTEFDSNNVTVINGATDKVVGSVPAGGPSAQPQGVGYDAGNGYVYVTNSGLNNITVINGATDQIVGSVAVGSFPDAVVYDSANRYLYVANSGSPNSTTVIDGTTDTVVGSIPVYDGPVAETWDDQNGYVYVAEQVTDNVTVIDGTTGTVVGSIPLAVATYTVSFTETGLPTGENLTWSVTLGGATLTSPGTMVIFHEPNGSYSFEVGAEAGYTASPAEGMLDVDGTSVVQPIQFSASSNGSASVTFTESGLTTRSSEAKLAADGWSVVLNGSKEWSRSSSITFSGLTNGTYPVLVVGPSGIEASGSGTVTVSGPTSVAVAMSVGRTGTLTFAERGLPSGQTWSVALDGAPVSSTTTTAKWQNLSPGTYRYDVLAPLAGQNLTVRIGSVDLYGSTGGIAVTGSARASLTFAYRYAVTFTESGLTGGSWSVTLKGATVTEPYNDPIVFAETNGSYRYRIGSVSGYTSSGLPKKALVPSAPAVSVTFAVKKGGTRSPSAWSWLPTFVVAAAVPFSARQSRQLRSMASVLR